MLYYFSGTGNSRLVCQELATALGEEYCPMTHAARTTDNTIGIVFPVYAWGMPHIVKAFIEVSLRKLMDAHEHTYIYIVMTCGDDMGYTDRLVAKSLSRNHLALSAAFSIQMPNTYVSLPGFDVDSKETEARKISRAKELIPQITSSIKQHSPRTTVERGSFAWFKTYVLRPLFMIFLMDDKRFHTASSCSHCGKCSKTCPVGNIVMKRSDDNASACAVPSWQHKCENCLACYHACPQHAIRYGRFTDEKGQKRML